MWVNFQGSHKKLKELCDLIEWAEAKGDVDIANALKMNADTPTEQPILILTTLKEVNNGTKNSNINHT